MMVITTNHFNKLDPALIRPGRVDTCLELKRCKPEAILAIFNIFYGEENLPDNFDINKVFKFVLVILICFIKSMLLVPNAFLSIFTLHSIEIHFYWDHLRFGTKLLRSIFFLSKRIKRHW